MQPVTSATIAAGTAGRLCPTGASTTPAPPRIGVACERMPAAIVEARMPPRSRTLGDLLDETARARPDADAVIFRDRRLTYGALQARADELARARLAVGVRKGDRVAVLLPNRPEWLVAAFAIGKLGAITVGVSTFSAPREIAWTIEHCRPAAIITLEAFRGRSYLDPLYATCPELATSSPGERQRLTAADRVWLAVPLFWSFGSANALPAIVTHGGSFVLQESFEPGEALALLDEQRCSVYYGMANMARAILEHPDRPRRALAAMRTGLTIGLPEDIQMTMEAVAARELCNVYGSTETYGNCAVTDAHDALALRLQTQGRPLPGMTIRVVDPETGRARPPGDVGEFRVRGHVTPGYYNDAEQTRAAFDAEGYFVTGDLGLIDDDGRVRFRGRLKEMIKTGGINVAPLEVEAVLLSHSAVKQAYVVGVPDRARGELVVAAVELHDGAPASAEALAAFCRERLAGYKVPARFVFRKADEFPRTPTGKVQKPRLRDELA